MKYKMLAALILLHGTVQAHSFITTFVNTSLININLELHFSDNSIANKGIAMSQSYQVVNFDNKVIKFIQFSSLDKDKSGNFYGQLKQDFAAPKADTTYNISLETVPSHIIPAGDGHEEFQMPESQKIVCNLTANKVAIDNKVAKDSVTSEVKPVGRR